jgi:hypothetical protein
MFSYVGEQLLSLILEFDRGTIKTSENYLYQCFFARTTRIFSLGVLAGNARFAEDFDMSVAELPISIDHQKMAAFCRARSIGRLSELI